MKKSVTEKALRAASAEYAAGAASVDRRLQELAQEEQKLRDDKRATLGAKYAIDRLIESLAAPRAAAPVPAASSARSSSARAPVVP